MSPAPDASAPCPACLGPLRPWRALGPASPEGFDPFFQITPEGRSFRHVECPVCALLACDPVPTEAELIQVYGGRYNFDWFRRRRALKQLQARHRWWRLRRWMPAPGGLRGRRPRLLDIGAGQGDFVRVARRAGWEAIGLDPAAPSGGTDDAVRRGGVRDLPGLAGAWELITLWHCLEHLPDPRGALEQAGRLLAPGGRLVLAVPNRRARGLEMAGRHWGWLQEPYVHLWHFTPEALERLLPAPLRPLAVETREAWDQQTWFAARSYGRLINRLPARSLYRREALHLAGFTRSELARMLGGAPAAERMDHPELILVAAHRDGSVGVTR